MPSVQHTVPGIGPPMMHGPPPHKKNLNRNTRQPDNDSRGSLKGTCDKMANDFFFLKQCEKQEWEHILVHQGAL